MTEEILDVTPTVVEEKPKEPPKCVRHPDQVEPCSICARLRAEGEAAAAIRRKVRAIRRYNRARAFFDASNKRLEERIKAQRHIIDKREAWVKAERERLSKERTKE
jgi:hypothetical protein